MNREVPIKLEEKFFGEGGLEGKKKKIEKAKEVRVVPSEAQVAQRRTEDRARREREAEARVQAWIDTGMEPKDRQETLKNIIGDMEAEFEEMEPEQKETTEAFNKRSAEALDELESTKMELAVLERRLQELAKAVEGAEIFVKNELRVAGVPPAKLSETIQQDIVRLKEGLLHGERGSNQQQLARKFLDERNAQLTYLRSLQSDPHFAEQLAVQRAEQQEAVAKAEKERQAAEEYSRATTVGETITPEDYDMDEDVIEKEAESVVEELPQSALERLEDEGEIVNIDEEEYNSDPATEKAAQTVSPSPELPQEKPAMVKKAKPIPYAAPTISGGLSPNYAMPKSAERIQPERYNLGKLVTDTARDVGGWFKGLFGSSKAEDKGRVFASTEDIRTTLDTKRVNEGLISHDKAILNKNVRDLAGQRNREALAQKRIEQALLKDSETLRLKAILKANPDMLPRNRKDIEEKLQARREALAGKPQPRRKEKVDEAAAAK